MMSFFMVTILIAFDEIAYTLDTAKKVLHTCRQRF
jgi:hypothetical protein